MNTDLLGTQVRGRGVDPVIRGSSGVAQQVEREGSQRQRTHPEGSEKRHTIVHKGGINTERFQIVIQRLSIMSLCPGVLDSFLSTPSFLGITSTPFVPIVKLSLALPHINITQS